MRIFKDRDDMVQVRVMGKNSYQIKRIIEAIENEKGFELMSKSGILKNTGHGPKLREFISLKDLKEERKEAKRNSRPNRNMRVNRQYCFQ